jgi:hypothetical protein
MPMLVINTMFGIIFNFFGFGPFNIAVSLFSATTWGGLSTSSPSPSCDRPSTTSFTATAQRLPS